MTITTKEFNVKTNTAELWNYTLKGDRVISSYLLMSVPVAPWADRKEVMIALMDYAMDTGAWAR